MKAVEKAAPKRTKARGLTLVNWRGVFYMNYSLDPQVTAFEGTNGAGKTTVMIAAYMVMLPDMTRLRFTNLGETSATGGDRGIWGRLGDGSRPSYTILDLELGDGSRMLAGVQLEKKAEPTVEPTPFVVHGLSWDVKLSELFLEKDGAFESVPELDRVKALCAAAGGKAKVFGTAKDYFAELFDRGVLPLRMQLDEEKNKLNEMLRTSMVGGISRALTGGMREFLLREEGGLAEVLRRMRGNLEACRRTRREVEEARKLEGEIHGVWEVGQAMFSAVLNAVKKEAEERQVALADASKRSEDATETRLEIERALAVKRVRVEDIMARRVAVRGEATESKGRLEKKKRGWEVARKLARLGRERDGLEGEREQRERADAQSQAEREGARSAWDRAREALSAASRGVADLKAGLEELERRAAEHRIALERLEQVRVALPDEDIGATHAELVKVQGSITRRLTGHIARLDDEILVAERTISQATLMRGDYDRAYMALERLSGFPVLSDKAHEKAREILADLVRQETELKGLSGLQKAWDEANRLSRKQAEVREAARQLGALASSADVVRALEDAELAESSAAEAQRKARVTADDHARLSKEREAELKKLEPLAERWRSLRTKVADRVAKHADLLSKPVSTSADLLALKKRIESEQKAHLKIRDALEAELEALERALMGLHGSAQGLDDRLLASRDAVGGELLMHRFEDLELADAALAEAALGPLANAIAVDDPVKAGKKLAASGDRPDEVWLVGPLAALPLDDDGTPYAERVTDSVLLEMNGVVRLTRLPDEPRLGKRARDRKKADLEARKTVLVAQLDGSRERQRALELGLIELDQLVPQLHIFDLADPSLELEAARRDVAEHQASRASALTEQTRLAQDLEAMKRRRAALRKLLPDAHLLDLEDQKNKAKELEQRLDKARASETKLVSSAADRRMLEGAIDSLRSVPPGESEVLAIKAKRDEAVRIRDRLQETLQRWRWLGEHSAALDWKDAEPSLAQREQLRPALEAQLATAESDAKAAEVRVKDAETRARATAEAAARAAGQVISADQQLDSLKKELGEIGQSLGAHGFSEQKPLGMEAVEAEEALLSRLEGEADRLEQDEREARGELVRTEERHRQAAEKATEEAWRLAEEERLFVPTQTRWARLREEASTQGLLAAAYGPRAQADGLDAMTSRELWSRAKSKATVLAERVSRASDGAELAASVRVMLDEFDLGDRGDRGERSERGERVDRIGNNKPVGVPPIERWLARWAEARDWLRRRVPPQIAEVDDPLEALSRLREHLMRLEERLAAQEKGLRGQSGDVARNIDAQIRRAKNQVTRLNGDLEGVRFGAIEGMQIRARAAARMEAVLRALREGAAQQLLFEPNLPIEDAMDELFRRYGGGRTGGDRVLDYREYLDLQVEIRRRGSDAWEVANPTRLSTGEAIGVGAAVMMTTLKAWEHDANLLRPRQLAGTLRLLFLDEATRLSQDNLGILFELCERLELQLMIAAPEVARAEGNTTYRLVRALDPAGREEVRVSGRKVIPRADA